MYNIGIYLVLTYETVGKSKEDRIAAKEKGVSTL
jgi:hypothetical protein